MHNPVDAPTIETACRPESWSPTTRSLLTTAGLDADMVAAVVRAALAEDLAAGPDATTAATIDPDATVEAWFTARRPGILAGVPVALAVLDTVAAASHVAWPDPMGMSPDGSRIDGGERTLGVRAGAAALLTAERTALNVLCHLSGVATATRAWVDAVSGTDARIRDTRKTMPGLRGLEKYAVRCGGGVNHRMGLGDAALIKDNHVAAAGSITAAINAVRSTAPHLPLQVEVDTLDQLDEALRAGAQSILLDNFDTDSTLAAVALVRDRDPGVALEASGGLTLDRAAEVAATGVDFLAVGALTHSAPALDIGLDLA